MEQLISAATQRNWDRLNVSGMDGKLISRANKRLSSKRICPLEYFSNKDNVSSVERLVKKILEARTNTEDALYSLAINCLEKKGLIQKGLPQQKNIENLLREYARCHEVEFIRHYDIPLDETDLLGLVYQCIESEGEKNKKGMYYTPRDVANEMLSGITFSDTDKVLDPCCGSSSFFLCIKGINPEQLYGIDNDPLAVMISKFNLVMRFSSYDFEPQIYLEDYLAGSLFQHSTKNPIADVKFDYIITNPPWGAASDSIISAHKRMYSGESFSLFLTNSLGKLTPAGKIAFLMPESFLNVKAHRDVRELILTKYCLEKIQVFPSLFSGVTTRFASIVVSNKQQQTMVSINNMGCKSSIPSDTYRFGSNLVFSIIKEKDPRIIDDIYGQKKHDLRDSTWALGIVTGDNKTKLSDKPLSGWEPIYTGKEIQPYKLLPYKKYLLYDRRQLQQVARDDMYRVKEKLVYKFISNKLAFAYDTSGSLFLNSANILIPNISGYSAKSVLTFLNSEVFRYIYAKRFGEIKVLKGNLMDLPFPSIEPQVNQLLSDIADEILCGNNDMQEEANNIIYDVLSIDSTTRRYIRSELDGKAY